MEKKSVPSSDMPKGASFMKRFGFPLAFIVLIAVLMLPTPEGLLPAGHRMLAVLLFAVVIWITEAVTYPVSATIIASLMLLLLGTSPALEKAAAAAGPVRRRMCCPMRWNIPGSRPSATPS